MLKTIFLRELLEYFKSTKFLIGFCIVLFLMSTSTYLNMTEYVQRHQDYLSAVEKVTTRGFSVDVLREPQVMSVLIQGKDRKLGNQLEINYMRIPVETSGYMGGFASQHHRFLAGFQAIDYAFIVRVVMSLLVIFLAYNAICGEKMQGTLKLALSNALPRDKLILGKLLGGLAIIGIMLISATLACLLLLMINPQIALQGIHYTRLAGITASSALYLAMFFCMGLYISVLVNKSGTSLMILLQIWVFLIIIYPNLSVYLAKKIITLPGKEQLADQKRAVFEPYQKEYDINRKAFHDMIVSGKRDKNILINNFNITAQRAAMNHLVDMEYSQQMTRQMHVGHQLGTLSPAVLYDSIVQGFARTDVSAFDRFLKEVKIYWDQYIEQYKLRYTDREAYKNSDLPVFKSSQQSISVIIADSIKPHILLLMFSVLFFVLAYTSFLRKDVR
ncbi:ABC transporter permease subunit [bacterium]|nr:ABC transporter permease subunit [bacterium]